MHAPPKPRGPAGFDAFLRIAQRGVPFTTVPAQSLGYHTPGSGWGIDLFASQNFPPSPQIEAAKGLTPTREITPSLAFCVTNAPSPGRRVHRQVWVAFDDTHRPLPGRDFAPIRAAMRVRSSRDKRPFSRRPAPRATDSLYNPCWRSVYDEFDFPRSEERRV